MRTLRFGHAMTWEQALALKSGSRIKDEQTGEVWNVELPAIVSNRIFLNGAKKVKLLVSNDEGRTRKVINPLFFNRPVGGSALGFKKLTNDTYTPIEKT